MRAALYIRVSTEDQAREGYSLDAQLERLRAYCSSQGWSVAGVYADDGYSAKDTKRPELQRLLQDVDAGKCDVVLVYKLDRFTRSVRDLHDLLEHLDSRRVGFKSATEVFDTTSAMGRLFITIVAAMAQWERETIGERSRMGQVEMTRQGRWSGGHTPFGYDYDEQAQTLVVNESQALIVREIFRRYADGHGTRRILAWLNDPNDPKLAPRERWTLHGLKYLLTNPLYAGYVRFGYRKPSGKRNKDFIVAPGNHDPIISEDLWQRVQDMRKRRSKQPGRTGTGEHVFTGFLRCGLCGAAMTGRTVYRTNKASSPPRRYYECVTRVHSGLCKMPFVPSERLERAVLSEIQAHFRVVREQVEAEAKRGVPERRDVQRQRAAIEQEMSRLSARRQRFLDAFGDGKIPADLLSQQLSILSEKEEQLRRQLEALDEQETIDV